MLHTSRRSMTPHDIELKRYNNIIVVLQVLKEYSLRYANMATEPEYTDVFEHIGTTLSGVIDMFRKYAEREDDS